MRGAVEKAQEIVANTENSIWAQQFANEANPEVHRRTTGPELLVQLGAFGRRADAFVAGVGTGGTVIGVGGVLREAFPGVRIVAVEPELSPVLSGGASGLHRI